MQRLADLAVRFGANVQKGQVVTIGAHLGQEELARAIAASAYRAGAQFVDVTYFDPYIKRARIEHADDDTLDYVPPWLGERMLELGRMHAARISLTGPTSPGALDGLDPARAGRDQLPFLKEAMIVIGERQVSWTVVPCPNPIWAKMVYPELDDAEALAKLWQDVAYVCRLDEPDPIAAWEERFAALGENAAALNAHEFDAVHLEGPGTDLTIGLLPGSRWMMGTMETVQGLRHAPNLPTEEIFTAPDPERAEGTIRSTRPLVLTDGTIIRGLEVSFEGGRAVQVDAEDGAEVMRGRVAMDDGAAHLGEVALVDREGRVGSIGRVFYDTLLDENAVTHIALGDAILDAIADADKPRANRSAIHIDFMVGGDEVAVTGITREGERVPVLRGGSWQV